MKVTCPCGFSGTLRPINSSIGTVAKCFGCDKLYTEKEGGIVAEVTEMPKFDSWEELDKFLNSVPKNSKAKKAPTGKKTTKKSVKPDPAKNLVPAQQVKDIEVYQTVHFYLRKSDEFTNVLRDAREEKKLRHDAILVFAHDHSISDPCSKLCREVVK